MPILFLIHLSPAQRRLVRGLLTVVLLCLFGAALIYTFVFFQAVDQRLNHHPKKHSSHAQLHPQNAQLHPHKDRS